jgi:hypothetical protein
MNPIQTNKPVFFGDDGEVLKSGNIYIGQPSQWPLSFPKTVTLQDSAGSQFTAAQPLRTNSQGRIEYNGKAVIALVDGDYSMLVRDRNGVTVADGYTPFVSAVAAGASGAGIQVGTILVDIKQLNVTPGQTVRNVGKITATDGLGADWLVVSNTGNTADDIDLIDFSNGLQGQRISNVVYQKDFNPRSPTLVWSGASTEVLYGSLSQSGTGYYVIDTGRRYLLYFIEGNPLSATAPESVSTSYAAAYSVSRSITYYARMGWSAVQSDVTITVPSVISDGTTAPDQTITAIYKV